MHRLDVMFVLSLLFVVHLAVGTPSASHSSWASAIYHGLTPEEFEHRPSPVHTGPLSPTVSICNGTLIGTTTNLPSATVVVNKYLGIPYARSPPERFSPPRRADKFDGTLNATAWKDSCIQQFSYPKESQLLTEGVFDEPPPSGESEDCLYVNVYAPSTAPPPGGRAVMFWIYGGAYQFGTASQPVYDGSAFAAYQDVILVTFNYRTNVFGFPGSPDLPEDGENLGLLDQHKALDWTRENIAAFGGSPDKITIFGQSVGAGSVDRLILTNPHNPPFRGAILESFQATYESAPNPYNYGPWLNLTAALNCTSPTSNLSCVRAADASTIKEIIEVNELPFGSETLAYDTVTNPAHPAERKQAGEFAKVPVMGGTTRNEGSFFALGLTTLLDIEGFLSGYVDGDTYFNDSQIEVILAHFPIGNITGLNTPYDIAADLFTLIEFQCPQALWANQSAALGIPTWRYYYNTTFPNYEPTTEALGLPPLGVFHTSEIPIVFGTYPDGPVRPLTSTQEGLIPTNVTATSEEISLSKFMQAAWAQFAKDPENGPGWKALHINDSPGLAVISDNGVKMIDENVVDSDCSLFFSAFRNGTGADAYGLN